MRLNFEVLHTRACKFFLFLISSALAHHALVQILIFSSLSFPVVCASEDKLGVREAPTESSSSSSVSESAKADQVTAIALTAATLAAWEIKAQLPHLISDAINISLPQALAAHQHPSSSAAAAAAVPAQSAVALPTSAPSQIAEAPSSRRKRKTDPRLGRGRSGGSHKVNKSKRSRQTGWKARHKYRQPLLQPDVQGYDTDQMQKAVRRLLNGDGSVKKISDEEVCVRTDLQR